jgi:hypothetical protein
MHYEYIWKGCQCARKDFADNTGRMDKNEASSSIAEKEFHRSRWWAYKWLKRFDNGGSEGLKNKLRSARTNDK